MILTSLKLTEFRNYEALRAEFAPGVNVIYGVNACGKTNILEAVYMLAFGKSFRGALCSELIRREGTEPPVGVKANIEGSFRGPAGTIDIRERFSRSGKEVWLGGSKLGRLSELIGNVNLILFAPEDTAMAGESLPLRRKFIDGGLSQLSSPYLNTLVAYNRSLRQRNAQLRSADERMHTAAALLMWELQLAKAEVRLTAARRQFVAQLSGYAAETHAMLSGGERLQICYLPAFEGDEAAILDRLASTRSRDLERGLTVTGCHRDSYSFLINGLPSERFGSQGQRRTLVLSLKLAMLRMLGDTTGNAPILLLDDIGGELDTNRRQRLIELIGGMQVFVTAAELEQSFLQGLGSCTLYRAGEGRLIREN